MAIVTDEQLNAFDVNARQDAYIVQRSGAAPVAASLPYPGAAKVAGTSFCGLAASGNRWIFATGAGLTAQDTDGGAADVYAGGPGLNPILLSRGGSKPLSGNGNFDATCQTASSFNGWSQGGTPAAQQVSTDAQRVLFKTDEALDSADGNSSGDIYQAGPTGVSLISTGPLGAAGTTDVVGQSSDGTTVAFASNAQMLAKDTDTRTDLYVRSAGVTSLVSEGTPGPEDITTGYVSTDGSRIYFETTSKSVVASGSDIDPAADVYVCTLTPQHTCVLSLVSGGSLNLPARFAGESTSGDRAFFTTTESLVPQDTDGGAIDVYERTSQGVDLVSPAGSDPQDVGYAGASNDGSTVFLLTRAALWPSDTDGGLDIYAARIGDVLAPPAASGSDSWASELPKLDDSPLPLGPLGALTAPKPRPRSDKSPPPAIDPVRTKHPSLSVRCRKPCLTRSPAGPITARFVVSDPGRLVVRIVTGLGARSGSLKRTVILQHAGNVTVTMAVSRALQHALRHKRHLARLTAKLTTADGRTRTARAHTALPKIR